MSKYLKRPEEWKTRLSGSPHAGRLSEIGTARNAHGNPRAGILSERRRHLSGNKQAGTLSAVPMGKRVSPVSQHAATNPSVDRVREVMSQRRDQFAKTRAAAPSAKPPTPRKTEWTRIDPRSSKITTVHRRQK